MALILNLTKEILNLTKDGEQPQKLSLNLKKAEAFRVRLSWDGDNDLDLHALMCVNSGNGGKVSSFEDVLSAYNVRRVVTERGVSTQVGVLPLNSDGTFGIHGGALVHSKDATDGNRSGDDEWVVVNPGQIQVQSGTVVEVPLIAMIHPQSTGVKFRDVQNPRVVIENSNKEVLFEARLSTQFGEFVGVQMGSIVLDENGTASFAAVAVGFNQDFNQVLEHFS